MAFVWWKNTMIGVIKCTHRKHRLWYCFVAGLLFFTHVVEGKLNDPRDRDRRLQRFTGGRPSRYPLNRCQGDCDVDGHCEGNLICFHRQGGEPVPGCYGGERDRTPTDYCIDPRYSVSYTTPRRPELQFLGRNPPETNFPLQECEGDCDSNSDCDTGLVCYQRRENSGPVPGCSGTDNSSADYCVKSTLSNQNSQQRTPPATPFRPSEPASTTSLSPPTNKPTAKPLTRLENFGLKMYWEPHYMWQEESFDRRWCMECRDGKCGYGDKTYIHTCDRKYSQRYDLIAVNERDYMIRLHGTLLCFERISIDIFLYDCDYTNHRQFWVADFEEHRFEIKPFGLSSHCVTQRHHPKFYEEVELEPCDIARSSHTSYWMRY